MLPYPACNAGVQSASAGLREFLCLPVFVLLAANDYSKGSTTSPTGEWSEVAGIGSENDANNRERW